MSCYVYICEQFGRFAGALEQQFL